MRKTILVIVVIFSALLILSACGSNNSSNGNAAAPNVAVPNDTAPIEDTNNSSADGSEGTQLAGSIMTVAQIEGGLPIGATQEDVSILFDSHPYDEVTASMDGGTAWRYDFGAQADYSYEEVSDLHDQDGILNGDVPLQVFIYFDEDGKVSAYTAYQAGADGTITVYQTLSDGSRKVETI